MRLAFSASEIALVIRKFPEDRLVEMQFLVDTRTRKLTLEIAGMTEACEMLKDHGLLAGKDYRLRDAIDVAGSIILEVEAERTVGRRRKVKE